MIHKYFYQKGVYFKRELTQKTEDVLPVCFGIPASKIIKDVPPKTGILAHIIPGEIPTYIYDNESGYYAAYQKACFGITKKKAGWDCMRHYEILANGCIPYFIDIEHCPGETMHLFPRKLIEETNRYFEQQLVDIETVSKYAQELLNYTRAYLTTESIAVYMLQAAAGVQKVGKHRFSIYPAITLYDYFRLIDYRNRFYRCAAWLLPFFRRRYRDRFRRFAARLLGIFTRR
jgi:hypothetical protein